MKPSRNLAIIATGALLSLGTIAASAQMAIDPGPYGRTPSADITVRAKADASRDVRNTHSTAERVVSSKK